VISVIGAGIICVTRHAGREWQRRVGECGEGRVVERCVAGPAGRADLIALAPAGKARYTFLREFCGAAPRFDPRRGRGLSLLLFPTLA